LLAYRKRAAAVVDHNACLEFKAYAALTTIDQQVDLGTGVCSKEEKSAAGLVQIAEPYGIQFL